MPSLLYFQLKDLYNNVHIILVIGCLSNVFVVVFLESNCVNSDWEYYSSNQRMPSKYPVWMGHLHTVYSPYRLFHEKHVSLSYHLKLNITVVSIVQLLEFITDASATRIWHVWRPTMICLWTRTFTAARPDPWLLRKSYRRPFEIWARDIPSATKPRPTPHHWRCFVATAG